MRLAGRIDPGSKGAVLTGQRVSFIPARIAETSARLSFLLRPDTDGTVIEAFAVSLTSRTEAGLSASPAVTFTGSSVGRGDCSTGGLLLASFAAQPNKARTKPRLAARKRESKRVVVICCWDAAEK